MHWWDRAARTLYRGGWVANVVVGVLFTLMMPALNPLLMLNPLLNLLGACLLILWVLGWVFFWRRRGPLRAIIVQGGVERRGLTVMGTAQQTLWDVWLELELLPPDGAEVTLLGPLGGALHLSGLASARWGAVLLTTTYSLPPDTLRLLDGCQDRLPPLTLTRATRVLLVASCETTPWEPSMPPDQDQIRVVLPIADEDYAPVVLTARLQRGADNTLWRVI